jgi:hypothetical protein
MVINFDRGLINYVSCSLYAWRQYGPAIAAYNPLQPVAQMIYDKSPSQQPYAFYWELSTETFASNHQLPPNIFAHLTGKPIPPHISRVQFGSAALANEALARACISSARQVAEELRQSMAL